MRDTRRARLVLGVLLAAALVLLAIDYREGDASPLHPLRGAGSAVFGVAERVMGALVDPVAGVVATVAGVPAARAQIERLRADNARLRSELAARRLDHERSAELRHLLGLAGLGRYTIVPAQVVAWRGVPGFHDAVEIDVGARDGVRSEMTVVNGRGLVGRVVRTGPFTATVVLLSDRASAAGARLEGSKEIGVVHGIGRRSGLVRFRLLDSTASLTVGTRLVSFGSERGAPYVPGVPIGVVERVVPTPGELTRIGYARPYADLTALDVVGVVVKAPQRDPRDALLPPSPAAATPHRKAGEADAPEAGERASEQ